MEEISKSTIFHANVADEMKVSYLNYAMSVIVSRALPDVRDGLKPVHRRILYDMHEMGLRYSSSFKKSARIVGDVLGKYHPHGDASVYDALVRLAQDFSLRYPAVYPQGNFGSIDGDPPAAMRYTEAKMSRIGEEMLADIQKETVDYGPNYDDSLSEPTVLPAAIPFLLVNGSSGIAVGMATNMAPHNLSEVCQGIAAYIDNPSITLFEMMEYIKGPDFPTRGEICGRAGIISAFQTGKGKVVTRGVYEIEETKSGKTQIVFSQLPYQVNKAELVKKIAEEKKGRINSISEVRDESDRDGIRLVIELKKHGVPSVVINKLFKYTPLQTNFNINNLALVNGRPKQLGLLEMIHYYVEHRKDVIVRRTRFDLRKAEERAHVLLGLKIGLENIDEVIEIIKTSADNAIALETLMETFGLSKIQGQAIIDMRLGRLSQLETTKIIEELDDLRSKILYYKELLANDSKVLQVVKEELLEIENRYGDVRRTQISHVELTGMVDEDFIKEEDVVVIMTNKGFVKRLPVDEYKTQARGGKGVRAATLRDEDLVEHVFVASTHDHILAVSNLGKAYWFKVHEIQQGSKTSKGESIRGILTTLEKDEEITSITPFDDFNEDTYLFMLTREGVAKQVSLTKFKNARKRGIAAIILDEGDVLFNAILVNETDEVMIITKHGKGLRFPCSSVRAMGRSTRGVRGIKLLNGDTVVGLLKIDEDRRILMITEKGQGKQVEFDGFRAHGRGTMGQKVYTFREKTGYLVRALSVNDDNDIVILTEKGQSVRVPVDTISIQGPYASGVVVARLKDVDSIQAVAVVDAAGSEESKEDEQESEGAGTEPDA